jgi:hypothetical protein
VYTTPRKRGASPVTVDTNPTPLKEPISVRSGALAADIRTVIDAADFIRKLPLNFDGRLHWSLAGRLLEAVDANPDNTDLLHTATLAMKNALATEGMLAPEDIDPLVASWIDRRAMLANQLHWMESGKMRTGTNIPNATTTQDIARLRSWIAELDALIAEYGR